MHIRRCPRKRTYSCCSSTSRELWKIQLERCRNAISKILTSKPVEGPHHLLVVPVHEAQLHQSFVGVASILCSLFFGVVGVGGWRAVDVRVGNFSLRYENSSFEHAVVCIDDGLRDSADESEESFVAEAERRQVVEHEHVEAGGAAVGVWSMLRIRILITFHQ